MLIDQLLYACLTSKLAQKVLLAFASILHLAGNWSSGIELEIDPLLEASPQHQFKQFNLRLLSLNIS